MTEFQYPEVGIVIVTYDRPEEIRRTINALVSGVQYPKDRLVWHIADDSSPGSYVSDLLLDFKDIIELGYSVTNREGWGANVNRAMSVLKTDYIFLCEDDYVSLAPIDLRRGVLVMERDSDIGLVRYDGISAHTGLVLELKEVTKTDIGNFDYLVINRALSSHLNCYSNRPHLKHRRFHQEYGMYPTGKRLGATEESFAHTVKSSNKKCEIAILGNGIARAFDHIGKTRQGSEFDKAGK